MDKSSILVVDDSLNTLQELSSILMKNGYAIHTAPSGEEGFNILKEHPDIVLCLTDFNMPDFNGLEMIQHARNNLPKLETQFMMSTTEFSSSLKKRGKDLGVSAWILKPIKEERLTLLVSKIINRK